MNSGEFKFLSLGEAHSISVRYRNQLRGDEPLPPELASQVEVLARRFYNRLGPVVQESIPDDWAYAYGLDYLYGVLLIPRAAVHLAQVEKWGLDEIARRYSVTEELAARRVLEVVALETLERTSQGNPSSYNGKQARN